MAYIPRRYGISDSVDRSGRNKLNPTEIEFALRDLVAKPYEADAFAFDLIANLNASKMTVSRLKSGATNKAKRPGDLLWQGRLFFRSVEPGEDVSHAAKAMAAEPLALKNKPRFVIATNGDFISIRDTKFDETEVVEFGRLDEKSDFLLPLAGYERRTLVEEHPADIKAAKKLKKLYDAILAANPSWSSGHHTHELNLLMTRLLFCFYAEKTGIFTTPDVFTEAVTQHTYQDPSAVAPLLDRLFRIMNLEEKARPKGTPALDARFPYVNGSLFGETAEIPTFDLTARRQLLECGDLDWTDINPDIFGSMIQTIAQDGTRSDLGMHYTSVPNIMKVLQPLFLDELNEAFEKSKDSSKKLDELLVRLSKIRVFDPACGSGNFLVIAYKALRDLETRILLRIGELQPNVPLRLSGIALQNFYGLDVVDFACETTKLSLWIAEHQTNSTFRKVFGMARPILPLAKITTICCVNATREDWLTICPPRDDGETFVCGNPPYQGGKQQTQSQKADMAYVFESVTSTYSEFDYVSAWFLKLALYILEAPQTRGALVATNSISQGWHISRLWPLLLKGPISIIFAHATFTWGNSAAHNAGVSCVIVGLSSADEPRRRLIFETHEVVTKNISPYLVPSASNVIVEPRSAPLSVVPPMHFGNMTYDAGNLILSATERRDLLARYPQALPLIRRLWGSKEFLHSLERYCLWITDDLLDLALSISPIVRRIDLVREMREASTDKYAVAVLSKRPHQFKTMHRGNAILVPTVTSGRRPYLQIGLIDNSEVVNNLAFVIYDASPDLFAMLSSKLHQVWADTVGGRLRNDLRYSNTLVYNTFPIPVLSPAQKDILATHAVAIIKARAAHPGKSVAWLYNSETMPSELLKAHKENDAYIEEYVYGRRFRDSLHRIEHLFAMYDRMIAGENKSDTLFESA